MATFTITSQEEAQYRADFVATAEYYVDEMMEYSVNMWGHLFRESVFDETGKFKFKKLFSFPKYHRHGGRGGRHWDRKLGDHGWIRFYMTGMFKGMLSQEVTPESTKLHIQEYKHIAHCPIIGDQLEVYWVRKLAALVAHEVAHVVQHCVKDRSELAEAAKKYSPTHKGKIVKGHGYDWMGVYAELRTEFVNNLEDHELVRVTGKVPEPKKTKKSKWIIKRNGTRAQYWCSKTGLCAGHIKTVKSWSAGTYYNVMGRHYDLLGSTKTISSARKILEENLSHFKQYGREIHERREAA